MMREAEVEALSERELRDRLVTADQDDAELIAGEMERRGLGDWSAEGV